MAARDRLGVENVAEGGARARVLVVDDEPLNRELLRRVLQRDYEIEEAEDALHAVRLLEQEDSGIKLVLCDQLMPGRSGTDLAAEVHTRWPGIIFLLLTGYDDDPEVEAARDAGLVHGVVAKPWRGNALKQRIEAILGE